MVGIWREICCTPLPVPLLIVFIEGRDSTRIVCHAVPLLSLILMLAACMRSVLFIEITRLGAKIVVKIGLWSVRILSANVSWRIWKWKFFAHI